MKKPHKKTSKKKKILYNRVKVALITKDRTSIWLAERCGVAVGTVSGWCVNRIQPSMPNLFKIAEVLDIDVRELLNSNKP